MKLFIKILLMFMSPTVAAWEEYSRSTDGGVIRYFERSKIVKDKSIVRLPVRIEYSKPVNALEGELVVTSGLMQFELDCASVKYRLISLEGYAMPNLQGQRTISTDDTTTFRKEHLLRWHSVIDEKHLKILMYRVC